MADSKVALCITGAMRTLPELARTTYSRFIRPWKTDVILVLQLGSGQHELARLRHVTRVLAPNRTVGYMDEIRGNASSSATSWCAEPTCSLQATPEVLGGYPLNKTLCGAKLRPTPTFYLMSVKRATCLSKIVELESVSRHAYLGVAFMRPDFWVPMPRAKGELTELLVGSSGGIWVESCLPIPAPRQPGCAHLTRSSPGQPRCEVAHDWFAVTTRRWAQAYADAGVLVQSASMPCPTFSTQCACHRDAQARGYELTQMCLLTMWLRMQGAPFTQFPHMGPFAFVVAAGTLPNTVAIDPEKVKKPTVARNGLGSYWDSARGSRLLNEPAAQNATKNGAPCTPHHSQQRNGESFWANQGGKPAFPRLGSTELVHEYPRLSSWLECPVE